MELSPLIEKKAISKIHPFDHGSMILSLYENDGILI